MAIPSLLQKSFTDVYDEFLYACSHGDYLSIERLLHSGTISHKDLSATVGEQKISPMVTAIEHNHLKVIKLLLDHLPYSDFREALLLAIYLDLTRIAQLIMEHDTFKCFYGTFADWQTDTVNTFDESHFAAVRPIQLAAQYNRTTILYSFLKQVPHDVKCPCNECKSAGLDDSLRYSQLRLYTYRALSSEVYLALVSQDPIDNAFELSRDLSKLIENEPNFQSEYLSLVNQVSNFSARLLDHIRNQVELELLLTRTRLNSAIEHNQQDFIVHINTQQRLTDIWYEHIEIVRSETMKKRVLGSMYYFLIYIPMYIGYFWLPFYFEEKCRWYFHQPAIQASVHAMTYQVFLLILMLSGVLESSKISLNTEYSQIFDYCNDLLDIHGQITYSQKMILSYLKIFVLLWMAGYVYQNISQMILQRRIPTIVDCLITVLSLLYIFLFTIAAIQVHSKWKSTLNADHWKHLKATNNATQLKRECWKMKANFLNHLNVSGEKQSFEVVDTEMVTDVIFILALVCYIIHLCFFLVINEYVGPLLVSILKMTRTIYRWFIFILIFVFAYQTSFRHLFSYYSNEISYGMKDNQTNRAKISSGFGNIKLLTINVVFSLFGTTQNELTKTYINPNENTTTSPADSNHYHLLNPFTSTVGSFIYGSYAFFTKMILITMIIAYIKRLFNVNKQQTSNDWKFARAKFYMAFIHKDPDILPVPLNLIPTPRHLLKFLQRKRPVKHILRKHLSEKKFLRNLNHLNGFGKKTADDVMNCIVLRFLTKYHPFHTQSLKLTRQIQCKEDLSEIRHDILDEIQTIQQTNTILSKQISTVFLQLDQH